MVSEAPRNRPSTLRLSVAAVAVAGASALLACSGSCPGGLQPTAARSLAVGWLAMGLWVSAVLPLAATGLLAVVLLPVVGVLEAPEAFALFGNSAVFFLLGVFIVSAGIIRTGLSKRLALLLLARLGSTPRRLLATVFGFCWFSSLWMPGHAVAAMAFPVTLEVARSLDLKRGSRLGAALFLSLAWGCVTGSVGTLLGGARAPLALEMLAQAGEATVGFGSWLLLGLPVSAGAGLLGLGLLLLLLGPARASVDEARRILSDDLALLGPLHGVEWRAGGIAAAAVVLWVLLGSDASGLALVSVGAAIMVFALRVGTWSEVVDYVNWNVIVMYGGAVALGKALVETGAVGWLAGKVLGASEALGLGSSLVFPALAVIASQGVSNAAAVVLVLPVALSAPGGLGPQAMAVAVATAAGFSYCFAVSTPANAIAVESGYIGRGQMFRTGLVMAILSLVVLLLASRLLWPLLLAHSGGTP